MSDELMAKILDRFQEFVHDNNTQELRRKMEAAAGEVLADHLKLHPDQVPEHLRIGIRRIVVRPGQRIEADLILPRHMVPPEMLDDDEGEEWKR